MKGNSMYHFRGCYIPERMMHCIEFYIEKGTPPGQFLTAVLRNELFNAVSYADDENAVNLLAYVGYFYNEAPSMCWGSKEKVSDWIKSFKE